MRIRSRIQAAFLLIGLIPLGWIGWISLDLASRALRSRCLDHLESVAALQAERIEMLFARNLERLRLVSSRTQLRLTLAQYIEEPREEHRQDMLRIIEDVRNYIRGFRSLSVIGLDGRAIVSTNPNLAGRDLSGNPIFHRAQEEDLADDFAVDTEGMLIELLAGPLVLEGRTLGVVIIESLGEGFMSVTRSYEGLGETGETMLVRRQAGGAVEYLTPLRFDHAAALRPVPPGGPGAALVGRALEEEETLMEAVDYRGAPVLAVNRRLELGGEAVGAGAGSIFGLIVKMDQAEAFGPVQRLRNLSLLIVGGTLGLLLIGSLFFSGSITRPVRNLAGTATQIRQGNLTQRASEAGDDEIASLAHDFNLMAESLTEANRNLEEKVGERTRDLQRSNRDLAQYAYVTSHDLQEPLRMVSSYLKLLERRAAAKLDEQEREFLQFALGGARRMERLIHDLLVYARLDSRAQTPVPTDTGQALAAALANLRPAIEARSAQVGCGDLPGVSSDETQLIQLFQNLIGNAIKFCPNDRTPIIRVDGEQRNSECLFRVQDNGMGIPPEHRERVFKIFQRLHTQEEYDGTGIGLAICQKIVERHGGRIWVESEPGTGSTFFFTLPATPPLPRP